MRLTLTTMLSVDGVMQAPGGPTEDPSGGFEYGGWVFPHFDEEGGRIMDSYFREADAFLLGRRTYDIFAAYWPRQSTEGNTVAEKLNSLPKYVASATLRDPEWTGTTVLEGDAVEAVRELKEQPGRELQVHGSGAFARTLIEHGLIDVYRLLTFPVVLGQGRRLFEGGFPAAGLRLADGRTTPSGITISTYEAAGPVETGSFAEE